MLNFGKMRLLAAAMLVAAMFAACDKDKGGDNSGGKDPSGGKTPKVENAVLVGMDESRAVQLPYALYEQEEYEYVVYFTVSRVTDVAGAESLMAAHPEDVLVLRVPELAGETPEWSLLYDGKEYDQTDEFSSSLVSVLLGADDSLEMSVALTFKDSAKNVWAAWSGTAAKAGYAVVDDAWAVGKDTPVAITKVVETVSVKEGIRKYVLSSDAEPEVLTFTVAESYFAAPETLAEVGGDVKFVLPEGISDLKFRGESYPKAGADAYGVFKVTATANRDNMGTLGRTVTFTYEDVKTGEVVRVAYDNRVSVTYESDNAYSLKLGYEENARTGEFSGNVYSYTNGGKNYLLYSTVAGASTLNDLKGDGNFAYTVLVTLPGSAAPWTPSTPGFAMSAYEYSVDKVESDKTNWWDIFDDGVSSKTGTLAVSDADKNYLANKTLSLEDGTFYYTTDPSRATDNVYFYFDGGLTPSYSPSVRPSYRKAEQFVADYWGEVSKLEDNAGDPAKVLGNPGDGDLDDEGNYFRILSPEGQVIFHRDIHRMYVYYDKRDESASTPLTFVSQATVFGMQIFIDNEDNMTGSSYQDNSNAVTQGNAPQLMIANDLRTNTDTEYTDWMTNTKYKIPYANVVNVGKVTLDSAQTLANGWDNLSQFFEIQYFKRFSYWGKNDTDDSKTTSSQAFGSDRLASPYYNAKTNSYYGTTEKGSITVDYDYDTDTWTIDIEVLDSYRIYTSDNVSTGGTLAGTNQTFVLHYKGQLIGYYKKLAQK
ncbi:MAG: hypothetical protein J1E04_02365 [Alistipes sp.]|nr:hypothetical protein [Alistipes sp.]